MNLTSTAKGPLFESKIHVRSYPKEFIFAEKLETVVYRGSGNSRMKDFHDLYSLISLRGCLDSNYMDRVVAMVFNHRQTPLGNLPLKFDAEIIEILQPLWRDYRRDLSSAQMPIPLPELIRDVIASINSWLIQHTKLCSSSGKSSNVGQEENRRGSVRPS